MKQNVLVAGATGMLGNRIALHLLQREDAAVRLLLRPDLDASKREIANHLVAQGAEVVEGDLGDRESLSRATQGVDVIVSAVQGGPDVIVDGQVALAEVGKHNGVRRILPSDFGLDLFKATPGEHPAFNARASADARIADLGIEHIHMLQGAFMLMVAPGSPLIDYQKGTINFWGDGQQPIEMTTVDDTARMTARVALDRTVPSGKFAFAGDRISFQQVADIAEKQTGKSFKRQSNGDEQQLRTKMRELAKTEPGQAIMLAYQLYMMTGQTSLDNLQSDRYPDLKLQDYASFLKEQLAS